MSRDPEIAARTRFALWVLGLVGFTDAAVLASMVVRWIGGGHWQHAVMAAVTGLLGGVLVWAAVLVRRGDITGASERLYSAVFVAVVVNALLLPSTQHLVAASLVLFTLITAPRLVPLARTDRWVYIGAAVGITIAATELFHIPTRLVTPALEARQPLDLTVLVAVAGFVVITVRSFNRYPFRTKLILAFLVLALGPLSVLSFSTRRTAAATAERGVIEDLNRRTAATATLWSSWLSRNRDALTWLADGPPVRKACLAGPGGPDAEAVQRQLERLRARLADDPQDAGFRGAALWGGDGVVVAAVGEERVSRPPQFGVQLDAQGGLLLAVPACNAGTLGLVFAPGLVRGWVEEAARTHAAAVLVRDADGRRLLGEADVDTGLFPVLKDRAPGSGGVFAAEAVHLAEVERFVGVAELAPAGWTVALVRNEAELITAVARHEREIQVFTIFAAALATLTAFLFGRSLAGPITRLAAALKRFTSGETAVRAETDAQDEVGELAAQFNQMATQVGGLLHSLEQQAVKLQAEVAERVLQEQRLHVLNGELSLARDQAMAANRAKSTFLAHMSHELRTPLNAVIGYGELIQELAEERGIGDISTDTGHIVRSAQHLLTLINDILDLSKIEAGKLDMAIEDFKVDALAREVAEIVQPMMADNKNTLTVKIESSELAAHTDRIKLRQTLLNLLSNAAKFTHAGTVTLTVRHESIAGVACHVFSVADEGVGIPEGALASLFDPFTQVTYPQVRKHSGTGLGLAITRRLCWLMGGEIDVETELGKGTTFTVWIPTVYRTLAGGESWRPLKGKRGPDVPSGPVRAAQGLP
ncbi:MAG: HAMP domain-containing protein [Myxococcales bacterium]|nr:HAMP domain-containing protein [Myxococcales bacterium]